MLSRVLLHVVATSLGINHSPNQHSALRRSVGFDVVNHPAIFSLDHFGDAKARQLVTVL